MLKTYIRLVETGRKKIEDVPERYREQVREALGMTDEQRNGEQS